MVKLFLKKYFIGLLIAYFIVSEISGAHDQKTLIFPVNNFSVRTTTVKTSDGQKKITYRSYLHIPYVINPVDEDFQSLNVYVPVKVNDKKIDASNAPILFDIEAGGFLSVNNAKSQKPNDRANLALSAGYVVVSPGCRGRDNRFPDGKYYGKAPAAIVDLKAAVRYVRYNKGIIPGNTEWIVSVGCSAGGALSAILGTSGNNELFDNYLKEIGSADASDNIFAAACYSPITDLDHADMAYEWMFGEIPLRSGLVDQSLSKQLKEAYVGYQFSLKLRGKGDFGIIDAYNYQDYLLKYYLIPSANKYLKDLPDSIQKEYLKKNSWIVWQDNQVNYTFKDYVTHIGRMKGIPAFDDFNMRQPEPILFGNDTTDARHFTDFSVQYDSGNKYAKVDEQLVTIINMMNALYFIQHENSNIVYHWWLRNGTSDNHTSQTVMINLTTKLQNLNNDVNIWLFWDGGHCADYDPEGFIEWIGIITGYK
ncbi:MAG: alpha/beta hydrolase [Bacteroidales bacterium]|nr:alpha/beta hydrolase [Bacteroidales bacterium]